MGVRPRPEGEILRAADAYLKSGSFTDGARLLGLGRTCFTSILKDGVRQGVLSESYRPAQGPKAQAPDDRRAAPPAAASSQKWSNQTHAETILVIPDIHEPFAHPDALDFAKAVAESIKPTVVVFIGDEMDNHAVSDYPHDPDGLSASDEWDAACTKLRRWYGVFPSVKLCVSNHVQRPFKKAFRAGMPSSFLRDYREIAQAPDEYEWRDYWIIDGIRFEHGEAFSGPTAPRLAIQARMMPVVFGHLHSHGGVYHLTSGEKQLWAMNVGCLIDESAYVFAYSKHLRTRPTLGCGAIVRGMPYFVPMRLGSRGRWVGKL